MMFSKPPISKSKQLPLPPKSKRIKHELDDDNKENIFQKNTKNTLSNRQFGKDITNSISNFIDRNHSGYITKRNSFAQKELTKVHILIKKNPSASQLGSKSTKNAYTLKPHLSKKNTLSLEKKQTMPSSLTYHSINNSIKAKSTRGSGTSLRNSVSIIGNLHFQKSFGKNHKKEISNTLCVSQNKDMFNHNSHCRQNLNSKEENITKDDNKNYNSIKNDNNKKNYNSTNNEKEIIVNTNPSPINLLSQHPSFNQRPPTIIKLPEKDIETTHKEIKQEKEYNYFDNKKTDVQIPSEYINSIYNNLLLEEKKGLDQPVDCNYMKRQKEVNEQMRSILIDWLIDVHLKFSFTDETIYMTVLIIDRYLSLVEISRSKLQLLGITALMIACKHEEIDLPKVDDFIYITDNAYTRNEVFQMENDVLNKLNFSLLFPSPIKFFEFLANGFDFNNKQLMMGKYLMETFLIDIKSIKYKSSIISCACAYIVMKFFKMNNYYESYNKKYYILEEDMNNSPFNEFSVKECAKEICLYVDNIHKTNFLSTQKKFSKTKYEKVALLILGK